MAFNHTCLACSSPFQSPYKTARFCSNACVGVGKSKGLVGAKKRHGVTLTCEVCSTEFYRKPYHVKKGRSRFCSEPCRLRGHEMKMVDRTAPRPQNLRGQDITCIFCGTVVYRKKSLLTRNVGKTCGKSACMSAYGRTLWGLTPHEDDIAALPRPKRKSRARGANNFTALQRAQWIGDHCAWCGSKDNLALDHIIPVCAGGKPIKENAQTLCQPCNNRKCETVDRPMALKQLFSGG